MKAFILLLTLCFGISLSAQNIADMFQDLPKKQKSVDVAKKKRDFFSLVLPPVTQVYKELQERYDFVKNSISTATNTKEIQELKKIYGATSDKDLLVRLKPHPKSIALAQAAMESSWGTSRFFREANNIFGVWSTDASQKRIAAGKKRGSQTIWLRKFTSLYDAVEQYYFMIATSKAYQKFRVLRYESDDVYTMVKGLVNYSEKKERYVKELQNIIRHNKLTKYDN